MRTIYKKLLFLMILFPLISFSQNTISGVVIDTKSQQPLPGVNVLIQGTTIGTITDFDGNFKLSNIKKGDKIVFSFIGYENQIIAYNEQKSFSVSLNEETNELTEAVVQVGYGAVKKKDLTGSVTLLSSKEFNKGANVTAENLLSGRVAGVTINTGGAPGSSSEIRIRGGSSLFAKNDPLIVIDGLVLDNTTGTGSSSFLATLNPSTIESMTILKDASASAIYGSRASNGVIIITTKKGGKTLEVDYNMLYGSGKAIKYIDVFDADGFRKVIASQKPSLIPYLGTANTDWQKAIYRNTDYIDNNISLRGSLFGVLPLRLTLGNTYQEGLRIKNNFTRSTVSLALNPNFFKDHLKIKLNVNYTNEQNKFSVDNIEQTAIRFDPTQPIYDPTSIYEGYFEYYDRNPGSTFGNLKTQTPRNPFAQLMQTNDTGINKRLFGNIELDYKLHFFPAIRAVVNLGFDESGGERSKYVGKNAATGGANPPVIYGTDEFTSDRRINKLMDAYLAYDKTFGDFVINATAGYTYQRFESHKYETGNINDPILSITYPKSSSKTPVVLNSFFARLIINYKDKYLFTANFRREASSRFSKDNRWGSFPGLAVAWKVKEEFFKENKVLSDLKLRVGWGITGQQDLTIGDNIHATDYLQSYATGTGTSQYYFGTSAIPIAVSTYYNPFIKWEETVTYNAGIDYGILNNRITGAIDVYYKDSKSLLVNSAVPDGSNFSNVVYQNSGNFTTKGIEFSINADLIRSENFNWNVNFNVTKFERRIQNLIYNADILMGDNIAGTGTQGQIHKEGFTPNSFYVYKQLYDTAGKPIEGAFADLNGDGVINSNDKYIYKNPDPDAVFGFASTMNYKHIDFSFNLRSSVGNRILNVVNANGAQYDLLTTGNAAGNIPTSVLNTGFNTSANVFLSDYYVENASYLKMDNITLGYTFQKWLEGKASLRLSAGVQNVFTITKYSGLDPEITNTGIDKTIYPRQRSFLFGANVKF